jgi:homocitrate synthase NifV
MIKNLSSYEAFEPEGVGGHRHYPIGKHSGTATLLYHLSASGIIKPIARKVKKILPQVREIVTNRKQVLNPQELKDLYLCS